MPSRPVGTDDEAPRLEGRPSAKSADGEDRAGRPPLQAVDAGSTLILRGTVRRFDGQAAGSAGIRVVGSLPGREDEDQPHVAGEAALDGTYAIDVGILLDATPPPEVLLVTFSHWSCCEHEERVDPTSGPFIIDAVLEQSIIIEGRVVGPYGPIHDATVLLKAVPEGTSWEEGLGLPHVGSRRGGIGGTFHFPACGTGRYLLVAHHPDLLPTWTPVDVGPQGRVDDVRLEMRPGASLLGRVSVRGMPLPQVRVLARPAELEEGASDTAGVTWDHGRPTVRAEGRTDEDGVFRLSGLPPGALVVRVAPDGSGPAVSRRLLESASVLTGPRDVDVHIRLEGHLLEVHDDAADRASVEVRLGDERWVRTAPSLDHPVGTFLLPDDVEIEVTGRCPGYEDVLARYRTSSASRGRLDLSFRLAEEFGSVVLRLVGSRGQAVKVAGFRYLAGAEPRGDDVLVPEQFQSAEDGVYRFLRPAPGTLRVMVYPGFDPEEQGGYELPIVVSSDVLGGAEITRRVTFPDGGRIRVSVQDATGRPLEATVGVYDGNGRLIAVGAAPGLRSRRRPRLDLSGTALLHPAVEPGTYDVHVAVAGEEERVRPVEVRRGETAEIEVVVR